MATDNHSRKQLPDTAICLQCGYSLRGLVETRCPECGRAFDPNDSTTFGPAARAKWLQAWAGPPPRWHIYGIVVFTLLLLLEISRPGWLKTPPGASFSLLSFVVAVANPILPMVLALDYLVRVLVLWEDRREGRTGRTKPSRVGLRRWLVTPLCLLLIYTATVHLWPLRGRFYLSRPAFERAARACLQGQEPGKGPRWIGLYHVRRIAGYRPGTVVFEIEAGAKGIDAVGFVYDPRKPSVRRYGPCIARNWYIEWW